jgi:preprotein translocase subunit SecD
MRILVLLSVLIAAAPALAQMRSFSVGGMAIAEADIIDARGLPDTVGKALLQITLDPAAARKLATVAVASGRPLPIVLNGKTISAPILAEPIRDGVFVIAGQFTLAEADALAKLISGKDPLPDSLDDAL